MLYAHNYLFVTKYCVIYAYRYRKHISLSSQCVWIFDSIFSLIFDLTKHNIYMWNGIISQWNYQQRFLYMCFSQNIHKVIITCRVFSLFYFVWNKQTNFNLAELMYLNEINFSSHRSEFRYIFCLLWYIWCGFELHEFILLWRITKIYISHFTLGAKKKNSGRHIVEIHRRKRNAKQKQMLNEWKPLTNTNSSNKMKRRKNNNIENKSKEKR